MSAMGAVFNLNEPAHVVHWHFFQMSASNVVVIVAMLAVFALAILLPFPGAKRRQAAREAQPHPSGPHPPGSSSLRSSPPEPSQGPHASMLGSPAPARIENEP